MSPGFNSEDLTLIFFTRVDAGAAASGVTSGVAGVAGLSSGFSADFSPRTISSIILVTSSSSSLRAFLFAAVVVSSRSALSIFLCILRRLSTRALRISLALAERGSGFSSATAGVSSSVEVPSGFSSESSRSLSSRSLRFLARASLILLFLSVCSFCSAIMASISS